ncbi:MAG: hypothetical protein LUG60_07040 [Erysipelotrichaceae bacterium]|nr:hypothetical protein [Erysipelotrichaceae bacterium]
MLTNTITLCNQFLETTDFKNNTIQASDFNKIHKRNAQEFSKTTIHHHVTYNNISFPISIYIIAKNDNDFHAIAFECKHINKYNYVTISEYLLHLMMDFSSFMNANYDLPLFDAANIHIFSLNHLERIKNGQTKISHFTTHDYFYQFKVMCHDINYKIHGIVRFHTYHFKRMCVSFELNN